GCCNGGGYIVTDNCLNPAVTQVIPGGGWAKPNVQFNNNLTSGPCSSSASGTVILTGAGSVLLDYAVIGSAAGRQKLQAQALVAARKVVQARLGRPGIDALYFTSFVMQ
ncbi:MAG TPA: flagellar basal body-associated FliL family protein, partial [Rhodanobacter sp.]|nr:flagellar basal body-associated FliL family protein [Rhodanobacter sp.]